MNILIQQGWEIENAQPVAVLYEEAFGAKFSSAIPNKTMRIEVISKGFVPEFSFSAISNNQVVGLAGFQVPSGSLTGGIGAKELIKHLGFVSGLRACLVFSLFGRKAKPHELVMDGIVVRKRGQVFDL